LAERIGHELALGLLATYAQAPLTQGFIKASPTSWITGWGTDAQASLQEQRIGVVIPSGGGKTTLCQKFGYIDTDHIAERASARGQFGLGNQCQAWQRGNARTRVAIMHLPEAPMLLCHGPDQLPSYYRWVALCPSKDLHEANIIHRSEQAKDIARMNRAYVMSLDPIVYYSHEELEDIVGDASVLPLRSPPPNLTVEDIKSECVRCVQDAASMVKPLGVHLAVHGVAAVRNGGGHVLVPASQRRQATRLIQQLCRSAVTDPLAIQFRGIYTTLRGKDIYSLIRNGIGLLGREQALAVEGCSGVGAYGFITGNELLRQLQANAQAGLAAYGGTIGVWEQYVFSALISGAIGQAVNIKACPKLPRGTPGPWVCPRDTLRALVTLDWDNAYRPADRGVHQPAADRPPGKVNWAATLHVAVVGLLPACVPLVSGKPMRSARGASAGGRTRLQANSHSSPVDWLPTLLGVLLLLAMLALHWLRLRDYKQRSQRQRLKAMLSWSRHERAGCTRQASPHSVCTHVIEPAAHCKQLVRTVH
jgi:hypothetical protein